jgi:uncharacterized DUF497 family protein
MKTGASDMSLIFEWNAAKAAANLAKHHVTFEEEATSFGNSLALRIPDPDHSQTEDRFVLMGISDKSRVLIVIYCIRSGNVIRIISARKAGRKERAEYQEMAIMRFSGR